MCKFGAIILAAGLSRRMGKPKLFLPLFNVPVIHYSVSLAVRQKLDPIIVVGGEHVQQLQLELDEYKEKIAIIYNSEYEQGMSTSLKVGINAVNEKADGVFIFLADQPFVSNLVVEKLLKAYEENYENGMKIFRPRYADQVGHPILFDKSLFSKFHTLSGDEGGKRILKANEDKLVYVDFENAKLNFDIDTPQDYDSLIKPNLNLRSEEFDN